jgi:hypothetical protein
LLKKVQKKFKILWFKKFTKFEYSKQPLKQIRWKHNINYEGLELEIQGEFEQDEPSVGYKGGWSYWGITTGGVDISWMLRKM